MIPFVVFGSLPKFFILFIFLNLFIVTVLKSASGYLGIQYLAGMFLSSAFSSLFVVGYLFSSLVICAECWTQ